MEKEPKLRTAEKHKPPYQLNHFPSGFHLGLGKELIYLLATRVTPRLEGSDWEEIFSRLIGGRWKPTNVGLDDVLLERCAWSAKTVKSANPHRVKRVRLISGRNSPTYSYDAEQIRDENPAKIGEMVLNIWNARVSDVRGRYEHLRTVVLVKSEDLLEVSAFEFNTVMYQPEEFVWSWNKNKNLVGNHKRSGVHTFTWQPHGAQFTIVEKVPEERLSIRIKQPPALDRDGTLEVLKFDESWITIL